MFSSSKLTTFTRTFPNILPNLSAKMPRGQIVHQNEHVENFSMFQDDMSEWEAGSDSNLTYNTGHKGWCLSY